MTPSTLLLMAFLGGPSVPSADLLVPPESPQMEEFTQKDDDDDKEDDDGPDDDDKKKFFEEPPVPEIKIRVGVYHED